MKFSLKHIVWIVIAVLCGTMFFSYTDSLYRQYQREQYKKSLETEIISLQNQRTKLEKLLDYVQTDAYKELKAKENLGQKLPHEKVVVIPPHFSTPENLPTEIPLSERPPLAQWAVYFFGE